MPLRWTLGACDPLRRDKRRRHLQEYRRGSKLDTPKQGHYQLEYPDSCNRPSEPSDCLRWTLGGGVFRLEEETGRETIAAPNTPDGPNIGTVGVGYTYSTGGSSSDLGHAVEYLFSWGDTTYTNWSSSSNSSKSWSANGIYPIRAKARCAIDTSIESDWSEPLTVMINPASLPDLTGQWTSLVQTCRSTKNGSKCKISEDLTFRMSGLSMLHRLS